MINSLKFLACMLLINLLVSCDGNSRNNSDPVNSENIIVEDQSRPAGSKLKPELQEGKKWQVNPEMMREIRTLESEILTFEKRMDHAGVGEFHGLSNRIQKHIDKVVSSCTLQGEAHDALHNWLMPFIKMNSALGKTSTETESRESYMRIKKEMAHFFDDFE